MIQALAYSNTNGAFRDYFCAAAPGDGRKLTKAQFAKTSGLAVVAESLARCELGLGHGGGVGCGLSCKH